MAAVRLPDYLDATTARLPHQTAVVEPSGRSLTYAELGRAAEAVASHLVKSGVRRGDRVGVVLPKSLEAVAALFGIMKAGAAYVPVDYTAPAERARRILSDCQIRAAVVDRRCLSMLPDADAGGAGLAATIVVQGDGTSSGCAFDFEPPGDLECPLLTGAEGASDLAYILYTSGSTGIPKGVMLTHGNATSFVDWCSSVFTPSEHDRFSSHAPFHFDLSVLDVYLSVKHGATLHLIPDELGKNPRALAQFIAERRITVWYSTPSILTLLLQFGGLDALDASSLRLVLFAGEVFPVKHLRAIRERWPGPTFYNLYGPTETNVCTFARIPDVVPQDREAPYPIGFACAHCEALVLDDRGAPVAPGEEGLLYIAGPSVFQGYWNRPVENDAAFLERDGVRWYNTGDLVRWADTDGFVYVGRKDRMVKRRGYRIELGEIERAIYAHPVVREAAVLAVSDAEAGVRIVAFVSCDAERLPSVVEMKTFCGTKVPPYMSPDRFVFQPRLPKTSTDKVDYQALKALLAQAHAS